MFTFSFGSAFAATDAELAAQNEAMTYAENAMAAAASAQKALGNYSTAALDYATSETAITGRLLASDLINKVGDLTIASNMTAFKNEFGTWAGIKNETLGRKSSRSRCSGGCRGHFCICRQQVYGN